MLGNGGSSGQQRRRDEPAVNGVGSQRERETTFGTTVTSKVLGVLDDDNLTEHSYEFSPSSAHLQEHTSGSILNGVSSLSKHRPNPVSNGILPTSTQVSECSVDSNLRLE